MTEQEVRTVEQKNEIRANDEPLLWVRAKRQIIVMGWVRFMGESFQLPERFALGLVGAGEVEQWVDFTRPLDWLQNAPGPHEPYNQRFDFAVQGSREGGTAQRGGQPGDLQARQQLAAIAATDLQPQVERGTPLPPVPERAGEFKGAHPPRRQPTHHQPPSPVRAPFRH